MDNEKKTVGEHAVNLLNKGEKIEVGELSEGCTQDYMEELQKTAIDGLDNGNYEDDFYVVVMRKRERHLINVIRTLFYHRQTKPTPCWDIDLWRVTQKGDLFFCYSLPDMQTGNDMVDNPEAYKDRSPELLQYVWMFANEML